MMEIFVEQKLLISNLLFTFYFRKLKCRWHQFLELFVQKMLPRLGAYFQCKCNRCLLDLLCQSRENSEWKSENSRTSKENMDLVPIQDLQKEKGPIICKINCICTEILSHLYSEKFFLSKLNFIFVLVGKIATIYVSVTIFSHNDILFSPKTRKLSLEIPYLGEKKLCLYIYLKNLFCKPFFDKTRRQIIWITCYHAVFWWSGAKFWCIWASFMPYVLKVLFDYY